MTGRHLFHPVAFDLWPHDPPNFTTCRIFTKQLTNLTVDEKSEVTLECETSNDCKVEWFKDKKKIKSSDRVKTKSSLTKKHQLTILKASTKDSGTYICKTHDQTTKATLEVLSKYFTPIQPSHEFIHFCVCVVNIYVIQS